MPVHRPFGSRHRAARQRRVVRSPSTRPGARLAAAIRGHRRPVAAVLAVVALLAAVHGAAPARPAMTTVLVAVRPIDAGVPVTAPEVRVEPRAARDVPAGALTSTAAAVGRLTVLPVRRDEVLTDVRLVGPGLLSALGTDVVAAPVHLADGDLGGLVRAGDTVDVLAAGESGDAWVAAADVRVLVAPSTTTSTGLTADRGSGATVVVAVTSDEATALARASATARLSLAVHGG